jgi:hypothetical protein
LVEQLGKDCIKRQISLKAEKMEGFTRPIRKRWLGSVWFLNKTGTLSGGNPPLAVATAVKMVADVPSRLDSANMGVGPWRSIGRMLPTTEKSINDIDSFR